LFVEKIIINDFCSINHSVGNTVTDEFTDKKTRQIFFLGVILSIFSLMKMEYHWPKKLFVITLVIYFYINEKINQLGIK
jgi:hypothetical protein